MFSSPMKVFVDSSMLRFLRIWTKLSPRSRTSTTLLALMVSANSGWRRTLDMPRKKVRGLSGVVAKLTWLVERARRETASYKRSLTCSILYSSRSFFRCVMASLRASA